jgi:dUTP pyrophosphatase
LPVRVRFLRLRHGKDLALPSRQSHGAAGIDLAAAIPEGEPLVISPGSRALTPTGFAMALPEGYEGQIRPRSGLAAEHGVTVLNAPGTIDADYRGEIKVLLVNLGDAPFVVARGMRIAQLVVAPVAEVAIEEVGELPESARGDGGFGSTGVSG